jgi:hypothetical protein
VMPGQRLHYTVAFSQDYTPIASYADRISLASHAGVGTFENMDWAQDGIYELDVFNPVAAETIVNDLHNNASPHSNVWLGRLEVLTFSCELCHSRFLLNVKTYGLNL